MHSVSKNPLIKLISLCGQIAEHKAEKIQEHGMDEERLLTVLSAEEQATLKDLLGKLQKQWVEEHKKHHKNEKST